jgi:CRISPR-associated protein Cst2
MNLFATVLTYPAPSANYRGESEENRSVIQKITYGRFEYPIISPESIRNALRETLARLGLPRNRTRLTDEDQLAVRFADYPDPDKYADDFFFGYLVAASGADRAKIRSKIKESGRDEATFRFKRDSVFRMNLARGVEPFRNNAVFTQSPLTSADSPWQNAKTSALLHRETVLTAFQYPFALNLDDCKAKPEWTRTLLRAIGELNDVAGNHARSYFEMAPASIVLRLTGQLVAGYDTYGFTSTGDFPEVVDGILRDDGDYPGEQFYLGGKIVKDMDKDPGRVEALRGKGVTLDRDPRKLLATVGERAFTARTKGA